MKIETVNECRWIDRKTKIDEDRENKSRVGEGKDRKVERKK